MNALHLLPLSGSDFDKVASVEIAPEHEKYAGTVAEAFAAAEEGVDFHGVFLGPKAVGFFKIDRAYHTRFPFVSEGDLGLRAFIIDRAHHRQGLAKGTLLALPAYLRQHYPTANAVYLTVNIINRAAVRAYLKGGFEDTGDAWPHGDAGPQHIMRLML